MCTHSNRIEGFFVFKNCYNTHTNELIGNFEKCRETRKLSRLETQNETNVYTSLSNLTVLIFLASFVPLAEGLAIAHLPFLVVKILRHDSSNEMHSIQFGSSHFPSFQFSSTSQPLGKTSLHSDASMD